MQKMVKLLVKAPKKFSRRGENLDDKPHKTSPFQSIARFLYFRPFRQLFHQFSRFLHCYLHIFLPKNFLRYRHLGGILIEFAFSTPIIIILLFFVMDHYRCYELRNKLKSTTFLAASITQQIGNKRANKQLKKIDLGRISYASYLNFFHSWKEMHNPYPFSCVPQMKWIWVKKTNNDSYQYQVYCVNSGNWINQVDGNNNPNSTSGIYHEVQSSQTKSTIEKIHPGLVCDNVGDERVLVWSYLSLYKNYFKKSKLGFFVMPIKAEDSTKPAATSEYHQFQYKLVFTPKSGLFPVLSE